MKLNADSFPGTNITLGFENLITDFILSAKFCADEDKSTVLIPSGLYCKTLLIFFFCSSERKSLFADSKIDGIFKYSNSLVVLRPALQITAFAPEYMRAGLTYESKISTESFSDNY